jgi:PAS domain S-box-containing protein
MEQDLRRLAAVVKDSYDAITLQEFDGTIIDWNHGAERMYGYTQDEAIGMSVLKTVPEPLQNESRAFRDRLARGEPIETLETQRII